MAAHRSPTVVAGLLAGGLFFLHALLPNSHAWPLVWPLLGGVLAVVLSARRRTQAVGFWNGMGVGARTGLVAAGLFLVASAVAVYVLSLPPMAQAARTLGADGPLVITSSVFAGLGLAAALGVAVSALASAFASPFVRLAA